MNTTPQPRRKRPVLAALGILGAVTLAILAVVAIIGATTSPPPPGNPVQAATSTPPAPRPADFKLTPKVTEEKCYGEAGCAVTFHPEVTYTGPALDSGTRWRVTYEVTGVADEPRAGRLDMTGGEADTRDEHVRTPRKGAKIGIKVTGVAKR